jgi:hypothetical protein
VPHFVADQWKAICDKSMNEDHSEIGPKLGVIRQTANTADTTHKFDLVLDSECSLAARATPAAPPRRHALHAHAVWTLTPRFLSLLQTRRPPSFRRSTA